MTIGAAPRPDLTAALRAALPAVDILEVGALDDLADDVSPPQPAAGGYPLTTRRRDGRIVIADEAWLAPRVDAAVRRAEDERVATTLLLCAGGFLEVTARGPLVRPFDVAVGRLRSLGARRVGVVVPIDAQVEPSRAKWAAAGFDPDVVVGPPGDAGRWTAAGPTVDAVVLDYVGHPASLVASARVAAGPIPVVDLLDASVVAVVATMRL